MRASEQKFRAALTKEDYQEALSEIQEALSACVGNLIILRRLPRVGPFV